MRIYNLYPLLAGPIRTWREHLPRIRGMRFDTIYVNAFQAPGASGSLYAVRDPYELHPAVRGDATAPMADLVKGFLDDAAAADLRVITDLVLPHAARDAAITATHPEWFKRDDAGRLVVPVRIDAASGRRTALDDLAELDLDDPRWRDAQLEHFGALGDELLRLGFAGFRVSTAYKVPSALARDLLARWRATRSDATFVAATLGCAFEDVLRVAEVGYDYVLNSSRWWDFREPWLLRQYEQLRQFTASISFPEDHNSPRLAAVAGIEQPALLRDYYRARYLFAATHSAGVMMPMGYEFGCRRNLDPVQSSPRDWLEETRSPRLDVTADIATINALKAAEPLLSTEAPQRQVTAPDNPVTGLLRHDPSAPDRAVVTLINSDAARSHGTNYGSLLMAAGGAFESLDDALPRPDETPLDPLQPLRLAPLEVRVLSGRARAVRPKPPSKAASEKRLRALAQNRITIEGVQPELDGGRFPIKRVVGDRLTVGADVFVDGHDKLAVRLAHRAVDEDDWHEAAMTMVGNDRWECTIALTHNTRVVYTVVAWRDLFESWRSETAKKHDAGQRIDLELIEGRKLVSDAAAAMGKPDATLLDMVNRLEAVAEEAGPLLALLFGDELAALMAIHGQRTNASRYERDLEVVVDRTRAAFASWYEVMPRSQSDDESRHGTFDDVIRRIPHARDMGFDVLYFPPIHPIGKTNRKGRNNTLVAQPDDPGSPYAIGAAEGGHTAIHPELGTLEDFRRLVDAARAAGMELALDFAIQCSPDHPWIKENPHWFDWRPDGTIKFAENPPKKYEDIVNVHFYRDALPSVWLELRDVVLFWVEQGVRIFRVDNPHTKPLPFWEWLIGEVQQRDPGVAFLAEAFTRPKVMKRLAKLGFTQSYSYFTWRNSKAELTEYLIELTNTECSEYMRTNFFVNTPDINPVYLQTSGRAGFQVRAVLAATLSPVWGMYNGFELCEGAAIAGKEEYLDSEKYQLRAWDWDRPGNIRDDITLLNECREANPALWTFTNLQFHNAWDDNIIVYSKMTAERDNAVLVAINLDPHNAHGCNFEVPLWEFGLPDDAPIVVEDLATRSRQVWSGKIQHVWLDPGQRPYAIWRLLPPHAPRFTR
ncbi:MAG: maltotransferase domain-containing protein [Pseudomonadota bacterium]